MSETADRVVAAWRSMLPVRKSAAMQEERAISEAVIRSIVEAVDKHVEETMPILQAIYRGNEAVPFQLVPLDPNQWSVELTPDVPFHRMNGFTSKEAK